MIPYFPQPALKLGPLVFHAFGALVGIALYAGGWLFLARTRTQGMDEAFARRFIWRVAIAGLIGAHFLGALLFDPVALLEIPPRSIFSFAGVASGLAVAMAMLRGRADRWRVADNLAVAFNFGWIFGRLGCFTAHDHVGVASTAWIAVRFPDGPRLDLGLLECLFSIAMAVVFAVADRWALPEGFRLGLYLSLYGAFRVWRGALEVAHTAYAGLIADQWMGIGLALAGAAILLAARRRNAC